MRASEASAGGYAHLTRSARGQNCIILYSSDDGENIFAPPPPPENFVSYIFTQRRRRRWTKFDYKQPKRFDINNARHHLPLYYSQKFWSFYKIFWTTAKKISSREYCFFFCPRKIELLLYKKERLFTAPPFFKKIIKLSRLFISLQNTLFIFFCKKKKIKTGGTMNVTLRALW